MHPTLRSTHRNGLGLLRVRVWHIEPVFKCGNARREQESGSTATSGTDNRLNDCLGLAGGVASAGSRRRSRLPKRILNRLLD
eukprot:2257989-Prymnesium_polylepis.1